MTSCPGCGPPPGPSPVPVAPVLSMYDPVFLGLDELGHPVYCQLVYRNLLAGGEPGAGKSGLLNTICAHAALCLDARMCLLDGKRVELGLWREVADVFVGPDLDHAIATLRRCRPCWTTAWTTSTTAAAARSSEATA